MPLLQAPEVHASAFPAINADDEDVGGFEIPMDDSFLVGVMNRTHTSMKSFKCSGIVSCSVSQKRVNGTRCTSSITE